MNRGETPEPLILDGTSTNSSTIRRRNTIAAVLGCGVLLVIVIVVGAIGAGVAVLRTNSVHHNDQPTARPSSPQPPQPPQPQPDPQHTNLATTIRNNMDKYASPCDNFFQYSCGGWLSDNPLGSASQNDRFLQVTLNNLKSLRNLIETNVDSTVPAVQLARKFYYSCKDTGTINARGVQPLLDLVKLTGGWDVISVSNCEL